MIHPRKCAISILIGSITFAGLMCASIKTCKAHIDKKHRQMHNLIKRIDDIKQTNKLIKHITYSLEQGVDISIAFKDAVHQLRNTQVKANVMKAVQINYSPHYDMKTKVRMGLQYLTKHACDTIFKQYLIELDKYNKQAKQLKKLQELSDDYQKFTKRVLNKAKKVK